jgi:hypothetical protein
VTRFAVRQVNRCDPLAFIHEFCQVGRDPGFVVRMSDYEQDVSFQPIVSLRSGARRFLLTEHW